MNTLTKYIVIRIALIAAIVFTLLLTLRAEADDFGFHLTELSLDYARFRSDTRDPILGTTLNERLDTRINFQAFKFVYLNNMIHSETDQTQFRLIGWQYQMGVHVGPWANVYVEHFSQHILDQNPDGHYPVENCVGLTIFLYRR